ncbi:MAG: hypothetical protein J5X22_20245 [Candidatus Accumulibacter sp.]|uniref:hypothetical protein n=1 Tax=Accumulibacter sp. TaxID=2053492 RepID=UPI001AD567FE|nr:hypothetical protein [Accumulibacter sp.]MBN8518865.1 hypothetical protein [Accumulibacter sp.]MBO3712739.1 hypothetical protein [Accumulibacter sp.]
MIPKPLSTRSLLELIGLFDLSNQSLTDAEGQRLRGVPGWDIFRGTSLSAGEIAEWTECVGYAGSYPAPCGDERVPVELQEDSDPTRYRYRCPETFRRKSVAAAEVAVYAVRVPKLLHVVADLLDVPQALRRGIEAPAIDGVLWKIGKARIGPAHTDIWFVRSLASCIDDVFRHLHSQTLPDQGLVLSSGVVPPDFVRPPRNYRFASVHELIVDYLPEPRMDLDLLHRILTAPADGTLRPVLPVHFDEYTNTLTIRSKPKPWHIRGERQPAAVKYLYQQACNDRWMVPANEILKAAFPDRETFRSLRMQSLFSGNAFWEDYIVSDGNGQYGFRLD